MLLNFLKVILLEAGIFELEDLSVERSEHGKSQTWDD